MTTQAEDKLSAYQILLWVKRKGEVRDIDRIRLIVLPFTIKQGIRLNEISEDTEIPEDVTLEILKAAEKVIGNKYTAEIKIEEPVNKGFRLFRRFRR